MGACPTAKRRVAVYRHQLCRPSEPFIAQQAMAMTAFEPVLVGRSLHGQPPPGLRVLTLRNGRSLGGRLREAVHVALRYSGGFVDLLAREGIALVHAHFGVEGVYALRLARALDVPLVTTFHGFDATTGTRALLTSGHPSWVNYALFRRDLAYQGHLFICVSDFIRRRVLEAGFPEERTVTHYIGVDTTALTPPARPREEGLVLHVARLTPKKGTAVLLEAFATLRRRVPDARLVVIGDGPLAGALTAQAESLGIRDRVEFLGTRPHAEVLEWMGRASVLALPSVSAPSGDAEGLPMVVLEAGARGLPVVATRHGGIPEAIVDGETGLLVAEGSSDELADRLAWLLESSERAADLGRNARRHVTLHFDLRTQTAKLEHLYRSVMRSGS